MVGPVKNLPLQIAVSQQSTYHWTFEEDIHHLLRCGCDGIGVWRRKLADFGVEKACELLSESGLSVSSLFWAGGFTGSDGRSLEESVRDAQFTLADAAAIGAKCVVVYTGGRNNHTLRNAHRLLDLALERLLPIAEEHGIPLAIEPMHPCAAAEWTFLTSMADGLNVVERYASPFLGLVLDTYHFSELSAELVNRLAPKLTHLQLGDRTTTPGIDQHRCLLGEGIVPNSKVVQCLVEAGYSGFLEVELTGAVIEHSDYEEILTRCCLGALRTLGSESVRDAACCSEAKVAKLTSSP